MSYSSITPGRPGTSLTAEAAAVLVGKRMNLAIIRYLRANGPSSAVAITEATGKTHPTIWRYLKELEAASIVTVNIPEGERYGRSPVITYAPEGMKALLADLQNEFAED
ncbi:DNA-binding MarR family transcriptional regulator [Arthrobacter sp. GAS37]|uniref:ArsR/SmtB family transcription factor n=1 Tax=Arthrobacter sp. GAS37 TaxID=3156261 RepID=UPI003837DE39